jgi:poly(3-hydroxybutyrate) depolymerase
MLVREEEQEVGSPPGLGLHPRRGGDAGKAALQEFATVALGHPTLRCIDVTPRLAYTRDVLSPKSQAVAFAVFLASAVAPAQDTRPQLERRFQADRSLLGELMTGAQQAATVPGLPAATKQAIEALEHDGLALVKQGREGDATRAFYHAIALGLGRPWSARDEYARSLVLRTRATVSDPDAPVLLELGQSFACPYPADTLLSARAVLRGAGGVSRDAGAFEGIATDLVHRPWSFGVAARDLSDGSYTVEVEVRDGAAPLRRVAAPLRLVRGLERARADVERRVAAVKAHADTVASIRYPFDLALQANLGRVEPRDFDFRRGIEESAALLASLEAGKDPMRGATGDLNRHYWFAEAGEIMPYRLIVPESYDGSKAFPLIVALHGRGGNQDTMAMRPSGLMQRLARQHGYIVASPMGYRPDGGYGGITTAAPLTNASRIRASQLSEQDVMNVLERVVAEYRIDADRIYLAGHSGGGGGAWRLGSKYPERWAAIAPIATLNTLELDDLRRMRHIPVRVSHGDADALATVESARTMVARMRSLGMTHEYFEVPGGPHDLIDVSLPGVFAFFDRCRRARPQP